MSTKPKRYYHVTTFEGWVAINNGNGIKASDDGYIYILDIKEAGALMARHLVAPEATVHQSYGLFEIDPKGFTSPIETDTDGIGFDYDWTLKHQFRVKQPLVENKYITHKNMYKHGTFEEEMAAYVTATGEDIVYKI